jgi:hypothetical protein
MKGKVKFLMLIALFLLGNYAEAQGCSQCKLIAEQSTELGEASFGTNINKGILFLMTIPYILLFLLFRKKIITFVRSLRAPKTV